MYTRFGHWITVAWRNRHQSRARSPSTPTRGATAALADIDYNANDDLEESATYSGSAVGMSLHKDVRFGRRAG